MSFEKFRCMEKSEDKDDEEYAVCLYPKCWMEDCPHWQARDKLAKAQDFFKNCHCGSYDCKGCSYRVIQEILGIDPPICDNAILLGVSTGRVEALKK